MSQTLHSRRITIWLFLLYLGLTGIQLCLHDVLLDTPFANERSELHSQIVEQRAPAPAQYRILLPFLADQLHRAGWSLRAAYLFLQGLFTLTTAVLFHRLLARWFSPSGCAAGVATLFAVMPLTYLNYLLQPMDRANLTFLLLALELMAARRDWWLFPVLAVAMLNRETAIFIVGIHFLLRWDELPPIRLVALNGGLLTLGLGIYAALRMWLGVREYYADAYYLMFNTRDPMAYLYTGLLLNVFLLTVWRDWGRLPKLLRRSSLVLPFFLMLHWSMTIMREPRLWLPMLPILIGCGLFTLFPDAVLAKVQGSDGSGKRGAPPSYERLTLGWTALGYGLMLLGFAGFLVGFYRQYANLHLKDRATAVHFEERLQSADYFVARGQIDQAIAELERARDLLPARAEPYCLLGTLYNSSVLDVARTIENWDACLEREPAYRDRPRIEYELRKLRAVRP